MKEISKSILEIISIGKSVAIIGPTNSGKTWYVHNKLMPFLSQNGLRVRYFENASIVEGTSLKDTDCVIVDEVETLVDRCHLENDYPKENPFYSEEYLKKVRNWHALLKQISTPMILIVTRNNTEDIKHLVLNFSHTDWKLPIAALEI